MSPPGTQVENVGLHPALLDSCLHAGILASAAGEADMKLPFSWAGVELHAVGATRARVRISATGEDEVSLFLADEAGAPIATVRALTSRPVSSEHFAGPSLAQHDALFQVAWLPLASAAPDRQAAWSWWDEIEDGGAAPMVAVLRCGGPADTAEAVRAETNRVLGVVQAWVADQRFASSRMVMLTQGAMALEGEGVTDLAGAAVWGLVRTAQSEYPGIFQLADITADEDIPAVILSGEPQLVVRAGICHAARLTRVPAQPAEPAVRFGSDGTTLITGAAGSLGRLVAEHLVTEHGVRSLLLVSRRGAAAEGMPELESKLTALGAQVTVAACDVADRDALAALLAVHPVRSVVHLAGTLDDGAIASLTPDRMDAVLRPKVDAALQSA